MIVCIYVLDNNCTLSSITLGKDDYLSKEEYDTFHPFSSSLFLPLSSSHCLWEKGGMGKRGIKFN